MPDNSNLQKLRSALDVSKGTKYNIYPNRWTNIALKEGGIYGIFAEKEGQVIYVSDNPTGTGALRLTKNFQIETSGRTTLYVKGQNEYDIRISKLEASLAGKSDKVDTYTKTEVDDLINNNLGIIGKGGVHFKDILDTTAELDGVKDTAQLGDLYQCKDTGMFHIFTEEGFKEIGSSILDLSNYYNKGEIDIQLKLKANEADFLMLKAKVDSLADFGGGFTYTQDDKPDPANCKEGDTWFNPSKPMIYVLKKDAQKANFWFSMADEMTIELTPIFVSAKADQSVDGIKTFNAIPKSPKTPASNDDIANKKYVDDAVKSVSTDKFVTLDTEQTIQAVKTFGVTPKLQSNVLDNADMVNKAYVDNAITQAQVGGGGGGGNVDLTNYVTTNTPQSIEARKTFTENQTLTAIPTKETDIVTKKYVDDAVAAGGKVDLTGYAKLDGDNVFTKGNTFNNNIILGAEPTANAHAVSLIYANRNFIDTSNPQTIGGVKTFTGTPIIKNAPAADTEAANKKYVDDSIAKAVTGGKVDLSDYPKLSGANTFAEVNTFTKASIQAVEPAADTEVANKIYVDKAIQTLENGLATHLQGALTDGTLKLEGYAKLDAENVFTTRNTFDLLSVNTEPTQNTDAVNLEYIKGQAYVKLGDNNTFAGENHFQQPTKLDATLDQIKDPNDIPNLQYLDANYMDLENEQIVKGLKIFETLPQSFTMVGAVDAQVPETTMPKQEFDLTPKKYVDESVAKVVDNLAGFMEFKGNVADEAALTAKVADSANGDVYFREDNSCFYIFDGTQFVLIGNADTSFLEALVYKGEVQTLGDLTPLEADAKVGDLYYVTDNTAFYVFKDATAKFVVLGGGGAGSEIDTSKFVSIEDVEQQIEGQKTFAKLPKIADEATLPTEKVDFVTKKALDTMQYIAAKDDGNPIWTKDEYLGAQRDPNKIYCVEGEVIEEFPVIKKDDGAYVWSLAEYRALETTDGYQSGFYFIAETT